MLWILCLSERDGYFQLLPKLYQEAKPKFVSLWLVKTKNQTLELIQFKGSIPKSIKNWNVKKNQMELIQSKWKKKLNSIALSEKESKDFFNRKCFGYHFTPYFFSKPSSRFFIEF